MISTKKFTNDSVAKRFLSDFIIKSEQHVRVFVHTTPTPVIGDLVSIADYDLIDNSIAFYTAPLTGSYTTIEVATTPEEFGVSIAFPLVAQVEASAVAAAASASQSSAALASINGIYLGISSTAPILDLNGNILGGGELYFNSTTELLNVYNGASWVAIENAAPASAYLLVDTMADLTALTTFPDFVIVKDPYSGGLFTYEPMYAMINDGGFIVNGWVRKDNGPMNISWFGAVPGVDCASAIVAASSLGFGPIYIPAGAFIANATQLNYQTLTNTLDGIRADGTLNIIFPEGVFVYTSQIVINTPDAHNISINGVYTTTNITAWGGVSGVVKNYTVALVLDSAAGITTDHYMLTLSNTTAYGTDLDNIAGVWKVIGNFGSGIQVKNTSHKALAGSPSVAGPMPIKILKTVLKFNGCDGFRAEGGQGIGMIEGVAIVGDYDLVTATGTLGTHGIIAAAPLISDGGSSNRQYNTTGAIVLGYAVGISEFGEQGISLAARTSLVGNFVASCANRKRGFYVDGGSFRCKFAIGSGNGEDGFIADSTGFLQCAYAVAAGNGLTGFFSINHSMIAASYSRSFNNSQWGYEARGVCRIAAEFSSSRYNSSGGYLSSFNAHIDANSATANNSSVAFRSHSGGIIDAAGAVISAVTYAGYSETGGHINLGGATGATVFNADRNSIIVRPDNALEPGRYYTGQLINTNYLNNHTTEQTVSGTGDFYLGFDGIVQYTFRTNILRPGTDNTHSLGDATFRWSTVYAGTGTINTSDIRAKQQIASLTQLEKNVAIKLKAAIKTFKFNDAVAEKGDAARIHVGVMAQEVKTIFESEGLVAESYAILCYDAWDATAAELDKDGVTVIKPATEAGDRYGVRYEELLAFIISAL